MTDALALLLLLWPTGEAAACRVERAVDGDTLSLACSGQPERRTRMWGIQAPENWPRRTEAGEAATEALAAMLDGILIGHVMQEDDGFGRRVIRIEARDGTDLSCAMIDAGHAREDRRFSDGEYMGCIRPRGRP